LATAVVVGAAIDIRGGPAVTGLVVEEELPAGDTGLLSVVVFVSVEAETGVG